jgi:hypothetical protein
MTKNEIIQKHGIEYYEAYKQRINQYNKHKYHSDPEYAKLISKKVSERICKRYKEDHEFKVKSDTNAREVTKKRYNEDPEYAKLRSKASTLGRRKSYVKDGRIDLIENYDLAKVDNFKGWDIHHKDEIRLLPSGMVAIRTREELIEDNRYYNCPYNELIWMKCSEHMKLHRTFRK